MKNFQAVPKFKLHWSFVAQVYCLCVFEFSCGSLQFSSAFDHLTLISELQSDYQNPKRWILVCLLCYY